jgi:hypothetical protein
MDVRRPSTVGERVTYEISLRLINLPRYGRDAIENKLSDRSDSLIAGVVCRRVRLARGFGTTFAVYN